MSCQASSNPARAENTVRMEDFDRSSFREIAALTLTIDRRACCAGSDFFDFRTFL
jgi:hypothetical protein